MHPFGRVDTGSDCNFPIDHACIGNQDLFMARKVRLEFEGAIYHIINRGNYRRWVFKSEGAGKSFEKCLFEACEKSGWVLHAYVLMGNHYHLAIETPEANLVSGMTWLQSTFAVRFNRMRKEHGHLFQGRYKALLVQDGGWLGNLCHYIHLNPVRAGLTDVNGLGDYRYSSYWYLWRERLRPAFVDVTCCLDGAGGLKDSAAGKKKYKEYLEWMAQEDWARKEAKFGEMSRGWALGTKEYKRELVKEHKERLARLDLGEEDLGELRELHWEEILGRCLKEMGKGSKDVESERKSAPWKVAIAALLKRRTQAPNPWIAEKLQMGNPKGISHYVGRLHSGKISGQGLYDLLDKKIEV